LDANAMALCLLRRRWDRKGKEILEYVKNWMQFRRLIELPRKVER